jgi:hypothetical protein
MVQDVRSSASEVGFDLLTPEGVIRALALVRESALAPAVKRELRDLIFAYTSAGGDPALRTLIESELATLSPVSPVVPNEGRVNPIAEGALPAVPENIEPVAKTESGGSGPAEVTVPVAMVTPTPGVAAGYRTARPMPQFRPVVPVVPVAIATPEIVAEVTPAAESAATAVSVPQPLPTPDPEPVPMVPKSIVDEKLAEVTPPSEPTVEYKGPYREDSTADVARERINAIKQMINTKVGNPVNLVDMDNTIGRAYMTALLEAMKAVSGGGGDVSAAMTRLEAVVIDVEKLFAAQSAPTVQVTAAPVPASVPVAPVAPTPVADTPRVAVAVPHKAEVVSPDLQSEPAVSRSQVPVVSADTKIISPMAIASSRFKNVLPVTDQEPLKTPADLPTAAEVKARSGITDPLQDPDVDLGLEQLLSEWSLFKKSGMFGTGPRGRQHPLFLKLAVIPMPLILSGRFEGSTSEIRQSITDYMNGWRYEQGIIYEQDETFEHYLRRVIRHIIDSQTRRRGA